MALARKLRCFKRVHRLMHPRCNALSYADVRKAIGEIYRHTSRFNRSSLITGKQKIGNPLASNLQTGVLVLITFRCDSPVESLIVRLARSQPRKNDARAKICSLLLVQ